MYTGKQISIILTLSILSMVQGPLAGAATCAVTKTNAAAENARAAQQLVQPRNILSRIPTALGNLVFLAFGVVQWPLIGRTACEVTKTDAATKTDLAAKQTHQLKQARYILSRLPTTLGQDIFRKYLPELPWHGEARPITPATYQALAKKYRDPHVSSPNNEFRIIVENGRVYINDLSRAKKIDMPISPYQRLELAWSRDSNAVAYLSNRPNNVQLLYVLDPATNIPYSIIYPAGTIDTEGKLSQHTKAQRKITAMQWARTQKQKILYAGTSDGDIQVRGLDGTMLCSVNALNGTQGHNKAITAIATCPGNIPLIASASQDNTVKVWDTTTYKLFQTLNCQADTLYWTADGNQLVALAQGSGIALLWKPSLPKFVPANTSPTPVPPVSSYVPSPDNSPRRSAPAGA